MKPSDVLTKAADLIELHGHCTGVYSTEDGRLCIVGAMYTAVHGHVPQKEHDVTNDSTIIAAMLPLYARLARPDIDYKNIVLWNDHQAKSNVLRVLRETAENIDELTAEFTQPGKRI